MMHKDYCLCIYGVDHKTVRVYFGDFSSAVMYARANTTISEQYEIEMIRNGRWRWTTGLVIGGYSSKHPKRGGLL